ncbi:transcriptional regulator [Paenibacillus riograndensis]|uniref:Transcriptional regulator n=1 Tax=Paenibacillus riograndensis TaxID=483937 RepID=A0A132TI26_9BACL|nr:TetR/AcrR family transcriptional regulator [Paenibacillus riograndensis]KWX70987.1 transcriptional regulator [Paenibacillus riograndensis]KWX86503.1 transcriptional regulator [Paenibacillus riograndensis]
MSNKPNAREAIVDTASRLFFTQGYHATGLSQIIKDSDSPKGSLYYYFPHGKEELALTCINKTSEIVVRQLKQYVEKDVAVEKAVQNFILQMVRDAEESDYTGMVPFSFWVAVETSCISEELRKACQAVFMDWQDVILQRLLEEGTDAELAADKASVVVSLFEGALLQTLTCRSTGPLLAAAKMIPGLLG